MEPLDYHAPPPPATSSHEDWLLIILPFATAIVAMAGAVHWMEKPFFVLKARDVVIFGGAPLFCLAAGVVWCILARRRRLHGFLWYLTLAHFALMSYVAIGSLIPFFDEPWNR